MTGTVIYSNAPVALELVQNWFLNYYKDFEKAFCMTEEKDPNGLNSKEPGSKLDAGKSPIFQGGLGYFPRAIQAVSDVSLVGARKYSWRGWEKVPDGYSRYSDALVRHMVAEQIEGEIDKETGCSHAAQVAWNALARLELMLRDKENG